MRTMRSRVAVWAGGLELLERAAQRWWDDRLRVLAYHDVQDPGAFEIHLRHLAEHYRVVSEDDVVACAEGVPLPRRAVWLTFDDGGPGVVEHALPLLARYGLTATLFVCPAVVDTDVPFWWQVVEQAEAVGIRVANGSHSLGRGSVALLKSLDDPHRRRLLRSATEQLAGRNGLAPRRRQLSSNELRQWVDSGHRVGNHTWDHPLLDTCDATEQHRQVALAHEWLSNIIPNGVRSFAYPNGNWVHGTEEVIKALGYRVAVLFDHRLSRSAQHPLRRSRVRVSSDADEPRFRALLSGVHSATYHAVQRWTS